MSVIRRNTLVVDFSVLPSRPEVGKVQQFLEHEIKLNLSDVKGVQFHNTRKCVYIEMVDSNTAQRYVNAHNIKRLFACKGKLFKIPMFVDSETVSVRVHDLPPSVPHITVANFMMQFGDVLSVQNERWRFYFPGLPNGVRVLQMRIKHPIPSYLTIANEVCFVEHPNQIRTCRRYGLSAHPKQKCVEISIPDKITTASSVATIPPTEQMFDEADFPPISIDLTQSDEVIGTSANSERAHPELDCTSKTVPASAVDQAEQHNTNEDNDDDDDDNDDEDANDSSSSPYEANDGSNKRRLSTKHGQEKKKICCSMESQSSCDSVSPLISNKKNSNWSRNA